MKRVLTIACLVGVALLAPAATALADSVYGGNADSTTAGPPGSGGATGAVSFVAFDVKNLKNGLPNMPANTADLARLCNMTPRKAIGDARCATIALQRALTGRAPNPGRPTLWNYDDDTGCQFAFKNASRWLKVPCLSSSRNPNAADESTSCNPAAKPAICRQAATLPHHGRGTEEERRASYPFMTTLTPPYGQSIAYAVRVWAFPYENDYVPAARVKYVHGVRTQPIFERGPGLVRASRTGVVKRRGPGDDGQAGACRDSSFQNWGAATSSTYYMVRMDGCISKREWWYGGDGYAATGPQAERNLVTRASMARPFGGAWYSQHYAAGPFIDAPFSFKPENLGALPQQTFNTSSIDQTYPIVWQDARTGCATRWADLVNGPSSTSAIDGLRNVNYMVRLPNLPTDPLAPVIQKFAGGAYKRPYNTTLTQSVSSATTNTGGLLQYIDPTVNGFFSNPGSTGQARWAACSWELPITGMYDLTRTAVSPYTPTSADLNTFKANIQTPSMSTPQTVRIPSSISIAWRLDGTSNTGIRYRIEAPPNILFVVETVAIDLRDHTTMPRIQALWSPGSSGVECNPCDPCHPTQPPSTCVCTPTPCVACDGTPLPCPTPVTFAIDSLLVGERLPGLNTSGSSGMSVPRLGISGKEVPMSMALAVDSGGTPSGILSSRQSMYATNVKIGMALNGEAPFPGDVKIQQQSVTASDPAGLGTTPPTDNCTNTTPAWTSTSTSATLYCYALYALNTGFAIRTNLNPLGTGTPASGSANTLYNSPSFSPTWNAPFPNDTDQARIDATIQYESGRFADGVRTGFYLDPSEADVLSDASSGQLPPIVGYYDRFWNWTLNRIRPQQSYLMQPDTTGTSKFSGANYLAGACGPGNIYVTATCLAEHNISPYDRYPLVQSGIHSTNAQGTRLFTPTPDRRPDSSQFSCMHSVTGNPMATVPGHMTNANVCMRFEVDVNQDIEGGLGITPSNTTLKLIRRASASENGACLAPAVIEANDCVVTLALNSGGLSTGIRVTSSGPASNLSGPKRRIRVDLMAPPKTARGQSVCDAAPTSTACPIFWRQTSPNTPGFIHDSAAYELVVTMRGTTSAMRWSMRGYQMSDQVYYNGMLRPGGAGAWPVSVKYRINNPLDGTQVDAAYIVLEQDAVNSSRQSQLQIDGWSWAGDVESNFPLSVALPRPQYPAIVPNNTMRFSSPGGSGWDPMYVTSPAALPSTARCSIVSPVVLSVTCGAYLAPSATQVIGQFPAQ